MTNEKRRPTGSSSGHRSRRQKTQHDPLPPNTHRNAAERPCRNADHILPRSPTSQGPNSFDEPVHQQNGETTTQNTAAAQQQHDTGTGEERDRWTQHDTVANDSYDNGRDFPGTSGAYFAAYDFDENHDGYSEGYTGPSSTEPQQGSDQSSGNQNIAAPHDEHYWFNGPQPWDPWGSEGSRSTQEDERADAFVRLGRSFGVDRNAREPENDDAQN